MMARAVIFKDGKVELAEYQPREIQNGEVLIEAECTCISPGTELRCLRGKQDGLSNDRPYVPGYTLTGTVVSSRSGKFGEGRRVATVGGKEAGELGIGWGGHLSHGIVDGSELVEIPENVNFADASFAVLGSIAYHGYIQSQPKENEKTAVIGLGVIGQLCTRVLTAGGADVAACDKSPARVDLARRAGIHSLLCDKGVNESLRPIFPDGVTLLVDSTGIPQVIDDALGIVHEIPFDDSDQPPVRYVIQGSYEDYFSIDYRKAFQKQVAFIIPRAFQKRDRAAFLKLLSDGKVSVADLICRIENPENASAAYQSLMIPDSVPGTIVFKWK